MLIPNKYNNLQKSTIVIGANVIALLKKKDYNVEDLFQELKQVNQELSLNQYYNVLTFLWLTNCIDLHEFTLTIAR